MRTNDPLVAGEKKTNEYQRQPMFFCNIIWAINIKISIETPLAAAYPQ